jgi:hypothetical protein
MTGAEGGADKGTGQSRLARFKAWLYAIPCRFSNRQRLWRRISTFSKRLEVVAKPVTYLLATLGLLSVYIPWLKREWEEWALPTAWYQVGTLRLSLDKDDQGKQAILMDGGQYDAAAWNGGVLLPDLMKIRKQDILTNATAVGRESETNRSPLGAVLGAHQCLHVWDVAFARFRPAYIKGDRRETVQEASEYMSHLDKSALGNPDAYFRPKFGDPASCQPLMAKEQTGGAKSAEKDKAGPPVRQRINVWVKATKVSC